MRSSLKVGFGWIDHHTAWLEILAIASSPLIALQISEHFQRGRENNQRKLWVLQTLDGIGSANGSRTRRQRSARIGFCRLL
jgi:hypothetical protein